MVELDNKVAQEVMDRLTDTEYITCPDCNVKFTKADFENYNSCQVEIDFKTKTIKRTSGWVTDPDGCFRCPQCGSLNVDQIINDLQFSENL